MSVSSLDELAAQFVVHRPKLFAIAHRTMGSVWSADDAVQEVWLRLQRADIAGIQSLEAWLTTVVSRVCIDLIRQQVAWREDLHHDGLPEPEPGDDNDVEGDPADRVALSDELELALRVVLDALGPLERLALILHDVFALSYGQIAPIVERTPTAARQLASRARARLRAVDVASVRESRATAIDAFLSASRNAEFGDLLQLLDPEIELRSDDTAVELARDGADHGAPLLAGSVHGVDAVARVFAGRAELTQLVLIDGVPAAAYISGGVVHAVYLIAFNDGKVTHLDVLADPERIATLRVAF